jgi:hypothetical protein
VVFPQLLGKVGTSASWSIRHRRAQLGMSFSQKRAYKNILTLTLTKQALRRIEEAAPVGVAVGERYNEAGMHTVNR